jgi:sentrin-specific protease 1
MNTFFYCKVISAKTRMDKELLLRWTKNVDIFSYDYVLIPNHLGMHWTLTSINMKKRRISYLDSMGGGLINGNGATHQQTILEYLQMEHKDKKGTDLPSDWVINAEGVDDDDNVTHTLCVLCTHNVVRIPQQKNGSDCGVFTCRFAECIGRHASFEHVTQENMSYFRRRMIYEILKNELVDYKTSFP